MIDLLTLIKESYGKDSDIFRGALLALLWGSLMQGEDYTSRVMLVDDYDFIVKMAELLGYDVEKEDMLDLPRIALHFYKKDTTDAYKGSEVEFMEPLNEAIELKNKSIELLHEIHNIIDFLSIHSDDLIDLAQKIEAINEAEHLVNLKGLSIFTITAANIKLSEKLIELREIS